jgi:hypothetical protein
MDPIRVPRRRWQRSRERMLADRLLDLQGLRGELASAFGHVRYLDPGDQRRLDDFLAGCALVAEPERAFQQVLEREVAIVEGRTPPTPAAPGARPLRRRDEAAA